MYNSNFFEEFPNIELNNGYYLREQTINDYQDFFEYFSDPETSKYILSTIPKTLDEAKQEIQYWINLYQRRMSIYWAIADKNTDKMIGAIGFNDWNRYNNRAEISYDLNRIYWKKGIMSVAMEKILEFGFNKIGINRIQASTLTENKASWKLLKKFKFKHEGSLKQYRFHNNRFYDIQMYALTKDDYNGHKIKKNNIFNFIKKS